MPGAPFGRVSKNCSETKRAPKVQRALEITLFTNKANTLTGLLFVLEERVEIFHFGSVLLGECLGLGVGGAGRLSSHVLAFLGHLRFTLYLLTSSSSSSSSKQLLALNEVLVGVVE